MNIRTEPMRDGFEKFHLNGFPFNAVIHKIYISDVDGLAHNHPWGFRAFVIKGGYVEKVYKLDSRYARGYNIEMITRKQGDVFDIAAEHIHEIVQLLGNECWTFILPNNEDRPWGFWKFDGDKPEFTPFKK